MNANYGWIYTETDMWRAVEKEHSNDLLNDYSSENVIKSKDINTLIALINKHEGLSGKEINQLYTK